MKKNIWIWAIAALSMAACTSEDAPTPEQIVTENDWISPDGRVVVQLSADGLPTPTASVGRAAIEGTDIALLDDLGIFALDRKSTANYSTNSNNDVLLGNIRAKGTKEETLEPELHTHVVEGQTQSLKRISLFSSEANQENGTVSIYYYPIQPSNNYNFYGYYPRQEDANVTYGSNTVTVKFAATDGSVDLITGTQETNAPTMEIGSLFVNEDDTDNTNTVALDGYNSKYIRSIKYHNWLIDEGKQSDKEKQRFVPNIKFEHKTALLQFFIVANDKQAGAQTPPYDDQLQACSLRVKELIMEDVNTVATWDVKSNNITWSTPNDLVMVTDDRYNSAWDKTDVNKPVMIPADKKENAQQAGYLMVEPKANYEVTLTVIAPTGDGDAIPAEQTTTLSIPTEFKAGYKYNVYIQLYALQQVEISAELVDWIQGDDVDVPVGD